MDEVEQALQALAEKGIWARPAAPDSELVRVELRRAAHCRGIRIRTGYGMDDCLVAHTPDGLPAEEPWRGAAQYLYETGAMHRLVVYALERLPVIKPPERPPD
jgi:hypothetical protein